jgi:hypothetical protein
MLVPGLEGWGFQQGVALVVPHGAGAQQVLRGRELEGWGSQKGVFSGSGLGSREAKRWGSQWCVDLAHPRRQGSRQLWIWSSYMELGTSRS